VSLAWSAGPGAIPARAATGAGAVTLEIRGLKRTNQVLTVLTALLKLLDELGSLHGFDGMPPPPPPGPPPSGTGHPGPGPLPVLAPDDPPLAQSIAGS
jgi:hypothetical protein